MRLFLVAAALLCWLPAQAKSGPPRRSIKPVIVWSDIDSHIKESSFSCLRSAEEWSKVWRAHKGCTPDDLCPPTPEVDFGSYMVIALFTGPYSQELGLTIDSVDDEKDIIRLRFERSVYSIAGLVKPKRTHGYAFVVLPKSKTAIVIEERELRDRFEPLEKAVWRERARLDAVK
jgi:hypothetical protein